MLSHWKEVIFKPNTTEMHEVDIATDDDDEIEKVSASEVKAPENSFQAPAEDIFEKCTGDVIPGIKKDSDMEDLNRCLKDWGLPGDFWQEDLQFKDNRKSKTVYIHDLKPEVCINLIKNMQGQEFAGRRLNAYTLVEDTPTKKTSPTLDSVWS